jgi:two-component sensor histidine kinase
MKKSLIVFGALCLLLNSFCFAQNKDSLWAVYNNKAETDTTRLKALYDLANSYLNDNPYTSIVFAQLELQLAEKTNQIKYKAKALNLIGVLHKNKGLYPSALDYFLKALTIFQEIKNNKGIGNCYANMGNIYAEQKEFAKALLFYKKSLKARQDAGDKNRIASSYGDLGNLYSAQADFESALKYHNIALKIRQQMGDKQGEGYCYNNIGVVYKNKTDYTQALENYFKSLAALREVNDKKGVTYCYNNIGNTYIELKNYKLALLYCDSSLQTVKALGDVNAERIAYQNLAQVYVKTGKYKEAYDYEVKFKELTDSIFNEENSKQLGDMKTGFEVEKKEAELNAKAERQQMLAAGEEKIQQLIIFASVGLLLVVIVFSFFLYKRVKAINKQKQTIEQLFKEVHHRVKNNLQVITSLLNLQKTYIDDKKIQGIFQDCQNRVYAMASIHEKLYEHNALSNINFNDYIKKLITQLIDTYQLNYNVKYNLEVELDSFDLDTLIPLGLLTNEIISNSLKYAFSAADENPAITFKLLKTDQSKHFTMLIGDNGKGSTVSLDDNHTSFGMELIKILVAQLHGSITQLPHKGTMYQINFHH